MKVFVRQLVLGSGILIGLWLRCAAHCLHMCTNMRLACASAPPICSLKASTTVPCAAVACGQVCACTLLAFHVSLRTVVKLPKPAGALYHLALLQVYWNELFCTTLVASAGAVVVAAGS
jgi:hypothetical protein